MKKYTATFTCDRALWFEFKTWAHSIDSSASEQISKFMRSALIQDVPEEGRTYIDSIIKEQVHKFLEEKFTDLFDQHYLYQTAKLDAEIRNKDLSYLPDIEVLNPNPKDGTDTTENTEPETIDSSFSGEERGSREEDDLIIELEDTEELVGDSAPQVEEEISEQESKGTDPTDPTDARLIDNDGDTDDTENPCPESQIAPSAEAELLTDRQLKEEEKLKARLTTIEKWRLGKSSRIPKQIKEGYAIEGDKWRRIVA